MSILLVDNSNTRTKLMLAEGGVLGAEKRCLLTAEVSVDSLTALLQGWSFDAVCISSVVPHLASVFEQAWPCPCHFLSADSPHGLSFDSYPDRAHLGADRIANLLGMVGKGACPAIAVDLGTAVTYDVLVRGATGELSFAGGVIAPGLGPLRDCLKARTAQLPLVGDGSPQTCLGQNTLEALQVGVSLGFIGMVRETLTALKAQLGEDCYVVATGGDAAMTAQSLDFIDEIDPDLTFKGLFELSKRLNEAFFCEMS